MISVTSYDGRVVATDKETGKVVWDKNLYDPDAQSRQIACSPSLELGRRSSVQDAHTRSIGLHQPQTVSSGKTSGNGPDIGIHASNIIFAHGI